MPYSSITTQGIVLLCFPPTDRALRRKATETLETLDERAPQGLESGLRPVLSACRRPRASRRRRVRRPGLVRLSGRTRQPVRRRSLVDAAGRGASS